MGKKFRWTEDPNTDEKITGESWQAVPVKDDGPAAYDAGIDNNKGDTEMDAKNANAIMDTFCQGKVNEDIECTDNRPDMLKLAVNALGLATTVGFAPDHLIVDTNERRESIRISGVGDGGKIYELELSVTDPNGVKF